MPWVKQKISARAQSKREERDGAGRTAEFEFEAEAVSHDIELNHIPSSTSVFRTPSSVASLSENLGHEGRVSG